MDFEKELLTINRKDLSLSNLFIKSKFKDNLFTLSETKKILNFNDQQIVNSVNLGLLKYLEVNRNQYFFIKSVFNLNESKEDKQKVLDYDLIPIKEVMSILNLSKNNVNKLISEGYLNLAGFYKNRYGRYELFKRKEVQEIIPQIDEIKSFWLKKNKISRQLGAKKSSEKRKLKPTEVSFKEILFVNFGRFKEYNSTLLKVCFTLLSANYYIERKLARNIIDNDFILLRKKVKKKILNDYNKLDFFKVIVYYGDSDNLYCQNHLHNNSECIFCNLGLKEDFQISFEILFENYHFVFSDNFSDIQDWFSLDKHKLFFREVKPSADFGKFKGKSFTKEQISSYKIFETIKYFKAFLKKSFIR